MLQSFFAGVGVFLASVFGGGEPAHSRPASITQPASVIVALANASGSADPAGSAATTTIINQYITQPVIEREVLAPNAVTREELDASLAALRIDLLSVIANSLPRAYTFAYPASVAPVSTQTFANSQRIDKLANVTISNATVSGITGLTDADIPDGITASNYLPLSGGTLIFASSTQFSVFNNAYFGATATSSFDGLGNLSLVANGLSVGTNQLVVSGGNVGIGTSSPSYPLDIYKAGQGNFARFTTGDVSSTRASQIVLDTAADPEAGNQLSLFFNNNNSNVARIDYRAAQQLRLGTMNAEPINFFTAGTSNTRLTITGAGKIGIGMTPQHTLDVNGRIRSADVLTVDGSMSGNVAIFRTSNSSGYSAITFRDASTTHSSTGSERMAIGYYNPVSGSAFSDQSNNDGANFIETSNDPEDLSGTLPPTALRIVRTGYINGLSDRHIVRADLQRDGNWVFKDDTQTNTLTLPASNSSGVVFSTSVGIGTTTPTARLTVTAPDASPSVLFNRSTVSGNGALGVSLASGLSNLLTQNDLAFSSGLTNNGSASGVSEKMRLTTGGNLGIATTTPWRKLSVTGTVGFDGLTGATGAGSLCLSANNEVVYNSGSDSCLSSTRATKHDITALDLSALDMVTSLQPVSFIYNNDASSTVRYGFIAEDTAAVDAHLATYDAAGAISGIDDRSIISIVVKAIQQLRERVESYFARTEQLEARVAALEAQLAASGVGQSSAPSEEDEGAPDTEAPTITINGNNPATLSVGDTYADLGATVTDNVDLNLGLHVFVGGTPMDQAVLDTSEPNEWHIHYVATDNAGNTATSTRTVIVEAPSIVPAETPVEELEEELAP